MKKLCAMTSLFLIFYSPILFSQTNITYGYDYAGNRISKVINIKASEMKNQEKEEDILPFLDKLNEREIKIYPNPTKGNLTVEINNINDIENGKILIHSLSGTLVLSQDIVSASIQLNISDSPSGTYIMTILINEEQTSWKIIKE